MVGFFEYTTQCTIELHSWSLLLAAGWDLQQSAHVIQLYCMYAQVLPWEYSSQSRMDMNHMSVCTVAEYHSLGPGSIVPMLTLAEVHVYLPYTTTGLCTFVYTKRTTCTYLILHCHEPVVRSIHIEGLNLFKALVDWSGIETHHSHKRVYICMWYQSYRDLHVVTEFSELCQPLFHQIANPKVVQWHISKCI